MFKIAWIDDDIPVLQDVMEPLMNDRDAYRVYCLNGILEARAALETVLAADLILLDILGPAGPDTQQGRRPGLDFLKELQEQHHFAGQVICFSVLDKSEVTANTAIGSYHIADFVTKPVRPSELKRRIDAVLSKGGPDTPTGPST